MNNMAYIRKQFSNASIKQPPITFISKHKYEKFCFNSDYKYSNKQVFSSQSHRNLEMFLGMTLINNLFVLSSKPYQRSLDFVSERPYHYGQYVMCKDDDESSVRSNTFNYLVRRLL